MCNNYHMYHVLALIGKGELWITQWWMDISQGIRLIHRDFINSKSLCLISCYSDYLVLSQFTIALLEDSGWYKGNYTALEMLNQFPALEWGKGT